MIACVISLMTNSFFLIRFCSYKGIHVLVKVAGEVGTDQSALRMQASRALARLALDPDAHQPIMMSGALQHILALAKQDHMDPLRLDGTCTHFRPLCHFGSSNDVDAGTLALSKLGVAPICRPVIVHHLNDVLASPAVLPEVCRKALAEVHFVCGMMLHTSCFVKVVRVLTSQLDDSSMCHHLEAVLKLVQTPLSLIPLLSFTSAPSSSSHFVSVRRQSHLVIIVKLEWQPAHDINDQHHWRRFWFA